MRWRQRSALPFLCVALLPETHAAVLHTCIPFHNVSPDSQISLSTSRNTTWMIYHHPLVLSTNIPYAFTDIPIHFYTETDDFTVCGLTEWRGHYCDEFGIYTLRSTKTHRFDNGTGRPDHFSWWDTFEEEKYSHQVLVNEFVWWNDGERRYTVPYQGTWCVGAYQDGHYLENIEVNWTQTHGELTVLEWMEMRSLTWLCLLDLTMIVYLYGRKKRNRRTNDALELCATVFLYHWCWRCYLSAANHRSTAHKLVLLGWATLAALINVMVYRKLVSSVCSTRPTNVLMFLLITKSVFGFTSWCHHWFLSSLHTVFEFLTWTYIYHFTAKDMRKWRNIVLFAFFMILTTQYCITATYSCLKMLESGVLEKTTSQRMHIFSLELLSSTPIWSVLDKFCWAVVIIITAVYY